MREYTKICELSSTKQHQLDPLILGGLVHYKCVCCGQTSYLRWDGTFAWEGFRGLEDSLNVNSSERKDA